MKYFNYVLFYFFIVLFSLGCENPHKEPESASGIGQAKVKIEVGSDGLSAEQRNISKRLVTDNEIGSIKHLYIISAYSGQTILYSTVDSKVTSGGKRLTPTTVAVREGYYGIPFNLNNQTYRTSEVIQDDGTYGNSMNYLYWYDVNGNYHQHYVTGGQIVHISTKPLPVTEIVINMTNQ